MPKRLNDRESFKSSVRFNAYNLRRTLPSGVTTKQSSIFSSAAIPATEYRASTPSTSISTMLDSEGLPQLRGALAAHLPNEPNDGGVVRQPQELNGKPPLPRLPLVFLGCLRQTAPHGERETVEADRQAGWRAARLLHPRSTMAPSTGVFDADLGCE
jgi:hypothetical protein